MEMYQLQARQWGHEVQIIDVNDFHRLPEFDASFLRLDTNVLGLSFAASRCAWELGHRVVDDPVSMLTCMNKAHVQGLLEREGISTPETILLTRAGRTNFDAESVIEELGSPVVVKAPSGAFSSAVEKAHTPAELKTLVRKFASRSDVLLLQRFAKSTYDWRVVILCGEVLTVCRYHIPKGAWRIHDVPEGESRKKWAKIEIVPLDDVPAEVLDVAMRSCKTIGNGLYGVDLKLLEDGTVVVIEVNDNPNMDLGGEFTAESKIYGEIIDLIASRGPRR